MKNTNPILITTILFVVMVGGAGNSPSTEELIKVDVTKSHPQKKELILQDFMDVEYIHLETKDDFLNQGVVQGIGKKIIVVTNRVNNGDIFIYSRTGKALRKINRKGHSGEEYTYILGITLDEDRNEMFVNDHQRRKILVYDLYGKFKRSFKHREGGGSIFYTAMLNYDKNNLICYDQYNKEIPFVLISKQDGSITQEIKIPFKKKKLVEQRSNEGTKYYSAGPGFYPTIVLFKGDWILLEHSSDTVYSFLPDHSLRPFLVRTPPIQSMKPEVFLILRLFSDRYVFMETIKNAFDFKTKTGFPKTFFMYDRQEKAFSGYTVYNGDYTTKKEIYLNWLRPVNHEIESWQPLEAHQLVESYKKGELKGKLKEIAATLQEDDNPVIMLVKHRK